MVWNCLQIAPKLTKNHPKICSRGSLGGGLGAMLGSKIGLGSPLGGVLGPSWAQEPIKTPRGEEMDLQGPPWDPQLGGQVGPKCGQVEAKWGINWLSCGLVHSSLYPSAHCDPAEPHLRPTWPQNPSKMVATYNARRLEPLALPIRSTLCCFRC